MFRKLAAWLPVREKFARNVLGLFAANLVAQGLSFAAYPVLTRIYRPDQLGVLSVVLFGMLLLASLSTLRYEIALPMCRTDTEAGSVLVVCLAVIALTSVVMAGVLLLIPSAAIDALGAVGPYRLFLPLALLAFGTYNVLCYEASRVGQYSDIARTRMSQAIVGPCSQIAFGLVGAGTPGLLVGFVIGLWSGTLRLARRLLFGAPSVFAGVTRASVFDALRKYRRFPLFSSWAGVLAGSANVGNVIFTVLYGATVGGFIFLGDRIMMQPLRVSGNAFQLVFVGEAGRVFEASPTAFRRIFIDVVRKQAAVAVAWLGLIYLASHVAIPIVFGRSWSEASQYIDAMLFGYLPTVIAIPVNHTLLLMQKQRLSAALDAVRFVALIAVIAAATHQGAAPLTAVLAYSVTQGVAQILILAVMYVEVSRRPPTPTTGIRPDAGVCRRG